MAEKRAAIAAGSDPSPILEAAEHDLDTSAATVAALVVSDRRARAATWERRAEQDARTFGDGMSLTFTNPGLGSSARSPNYVV